MIPVEKYSAQGIAAEPDKDLVLQAQAGSAEAFAQLVERYYQLVYIIALSHLRSPEAAEELAQDVFLRVHLHLGSLRNGAAFAAWLRRIARNESLRWLSRRQNRSELLPLIPLEELGAEVLDARSPSPRDRASYAQEFAQLDEALRLLPASQREIVLLHFLDGQSKSEVARQLGLHPATVGRQLDRATSSLREQLDPLLKTAVKSTASSGRGLGRTLAAVAALAALPSASRAALAAKPAFSVIGAGSQAAASAKIISAAHMIATGVISMAKWKIAAAAGAITLGAITTYQAPRLHAQYQQSKNGPHAVVSDEDFESVLQGPAPKDYVIRIRKATGTKGITSSSGGSSGGGLEVKMYSTNFSTAYASIRSIPRWRVERLPANMPSIDVIARTPDTPNPSAGLRAHETEIWPKQREEAAERFLEVANLKLLSRTIYVPHIQLFDPSSAPATARTASSLPDFSDNTPRVLPPRGPGIGSYVYVSNWSSPTQLGPIVQNLKSMSPYPAELEISESLEKRDPVNWPGTLKLISPAYPEPLAQLLSFVYAVPYEVGKKETEVYLVYDPKTASEADINAWKNADARVTDLK